MKTLGMIGGTSWYSTVEYYQEINRRVSEIIGSQGNPELILYSINIELMRGMDIDKIKSRYLKISHQLEHDGADGIIICANTPHLVYEYVQPKISIPILHIGDAIGLEAKNQGLKVLGLLGNKPTMTGDFISGYLKRKYGIEVIIPEGHSLEKSHYYVSKELTRGVFSKEARDFYNNQMEELRKRGAEGMILGCTELPLLLKDDNIDIPTLSTTNLHIQMAVEFLTD
ncbi:aspartate/glutamate racemase family protein [Marinigracilibium pacificum]|uniref:Amino acid racemase n=1 Tax=Marinigracilibium pacificum TaxID=2729599 RepID=A0A848J661_9BACT|nr:amino acid racemase [Marinigracilibium pacificum]NMM49954.1 amino acid racemase [Marinigracilibium pacificum]